jgi:hemerythrin-like domain-containing protein
MSVLQPVRDEHRHLRPRIEQLRYAADALAGKDASGIELHVEEAHRFLNRHLLPHAAAEDASLYPAVARALGNPKATATMQVDHEEIAELSHELGTLLDRLKVEGMDAELRNDLRRVLYGVYTLVLVHFTKEERVYLPLLESTLTPDEAADVLAGMAAAEHAAAAHH